MTRFQHLHRKGGDDELTRLLRAEYAPPSDPAYWADLEARVVRTVREADGTQWFDLAPWMRWAVAAASLLAAVAGVYEWRLREAEARMAYRNVLNSSVPAARAALERGDGPAREETLRYLMTNY